MTLDWFRDLYRHMEWADAFVWSRVLSDQASSDDPFVRESLFHLHLVQRAYLTGWKGDVPRVTEEDEFGSPADMREWARSFYAEAEAFLDSLDESGLEVEPPVLWPEFIERAIGRPPVPIRLADMVYQVAAHSAHHRAQVNRRIRELGGSPPFIDFVAWAWAGRPQADWG